MRNHILILLLILSAQVFSETTAIHMISGAKEYRAGESMARYKAELEKAFDVRVTHTRTIDKSKDLPGLEALKNADILIIFCRRLEVMEKDLGVIKGYLESGKPVLGIRTASHAFQTYLKLDKVYFGGSYSGHDKKFETQMKVSELHEKHQVLDGLRLVNWVRGDKPYYNNANAADINVLITGSANNKTHPMAWTRVKETQRIFYTSMGLPEDFKDQRFIGLLNNAIKWLSDNEIQLRN